MVPEMPHLRRSGVRAGQTATIPCQRHLPTDAVKTVLQQAELLSEDWV